MILCEYAILKNIIYFDYGGCSANDRKRNVYRSLLEKADVKRPLGRPRRRWIVNTKVDLLERCWHGVDWISLAQDG
jgi:hypothetical protein